MNAKIPDRRKSAGDYHFADFSKMNRAGHSPGSPKYSTTASCCSGVSTRCPLRKLSSSSRC